MFLCFCSETVTKVETVFFFFFLIIFFVSLEINPCCLTVIFLGLSLFLSFYLSGLTMSDIFTCHINYSLFFYYMETVEMIYLIFLLTVGTPLNDSSNTFNSLSTLSNLMLFVSRSHEQMSVDMIDYMVDEHNIEIDPEKIKRVKVSWKFES